MLNYITETVLKSYKNKIYYYEKTEFQRMATRI